MICPGCHRELGHRRGCPEADPAQVRPKQYADPNADEGSDDAEA